jgi:molecular chaperone DnaK (HSP70)
MSGCLCKACDREQICPTSFSVIDKYCGLCGQQLRRIRFSTEDALAAVERKDAMVYPTKRDDGWLYCLSFNMEYAGTNGHIVSEQPIDINSTSCLHWNGSVAELDDIHIKDGKTHCVLPTAADNKLPKEGLTATVELHGEFGVERAHVRICNRPALLAQRSGETGESQYVKDFAWKQSEPEKDVSIYEISIWKRTTFEFEVEILAKYAPILCTDPVVVLRQDQGIKLKPNAWRRLDPEVPQPLRFSIDSTSWEAEKVYELEFRLNLYLIKYKRFLFRFRWVDIGDLAFKPAVLPIKQLFWGQTWKIGIQVANSGHTPIGPLLVRSDCEWIHIDQGTRYFPEMKGIAEADLSQPPSVIRVEVNTDLINRDHAARLPGQIVVSEQEGLNRRWVVPLSIDRIIEPEPLGSVLAIDLGSATSCAAYATFDGSGDRANLHALLLDDRIERSIGDRNEIPSAIYFYDLSDRNNPTVCVGEEALEAASSSTLTLDPQLDKLLGLVEDAKRWVGSDQYGFTVFDVRGNRQQYRPDEIVRLTLRELINRARQRRGIAKVELSFPTKFTRRQQSAYRKIVESLQHEYQSHGIQIELMHGDQLRLDEASAAAICFLYNEESELPTQGRFGLVSIDWGGGTLDHCVMELERISGDRKGRLQTTYRGFGGDARLGGNDVTCATIELLRKELRKRLRDQYAEAGASQAEIEAIDVPLCWPNDPDSLDKPDELLNFHLLRLIAEPLKIFLSNASSPQEDIVNTAQGFISDQKIANVLAQLLITTYNAQTGLPQPVKLDDEVGRMGGVISGLMQGLVDLVRALKLEQIYDYPLAHQKSEESIRDRLTRCLGQLKRQVALAGIEKPRFLLAGSSSRLPILRELLRQEFGDEIVIYSRPQWAKRRVAFGLAYFAAASNIEGRFFGRFARPSDVVRDAIGLLSMDARGEAVFQPVIPAGAFWESNKVDDPTTWQKFNFAEQEVRMSPNSKGDTVFRAYTLFAGSTKTAIGLFDLGQRGAGESVIPVPESLEFADGTAAWLRITGPGKVQLRVEAGGKNYGWFDLQWSDNNGIWDANGSD